MKKVIAILLALVMVFALAACGSNGNNNAAPENNSAEAPKWPSGDITMYMGYNESSPTAVGTETIAKWLREQTGVKVETVYDANGSGANLVTDLLNSESNGTAIMQVGTDALTAYAQGIWPVDFTDSTKFQMVTGTIQPYPLTGCTLLTQANAPYNTWDEMVEYAKAHPQEITVADRAGSIMTTKLKSLFNQTGVSQYITWTPTDSSGAKAGLLGGNINIIILDETTATSYYKEGANQNVKALLNLRIDKSDFDLYPEGSADVETMKTVPTLTDVFGAEKAKQYMVANYSIFITKADVPAEIVAQMKACIDAIADVDTSSPFYAEQRATGGTAKFYTWPAEEIMTYYKSLIPVIQDIEAMGKK